MPVEIGAPGLVEGPHGGEPPVVLSVSGSDSGAGAGAQADLKTYAALGVFGTTAITALTAQNTVGVRGVRPTPADFLELQIRAVLEDFDVTASKTGMLATADNVALVAELAAAGELPLLVVDPVMVNAHGDQMLGPEVERLYRQRLVPHAEVVTPNTHEAALLCGRPVDDLGGQRDAARHLGDLGPRRVVVKGGRLPGGEAVDVCWDGSSLRELVSPWVPTVNNHGTGCSFAAAVAAGLALGMAADDAIDGAKAYVSAAVTGGASWRLGQGRGPIDHLGFARRAPLAGPDRASGSRSPWS